jgi:hypothetical protein
VTLKPQDKPTITHDCSTYEDTYTWPIRKKGGTPLSCPRCKARLDVKTAVFWENPVVADNDVS